MSPGDWDFGDVIVGESRTVVYELMGVEDDDLRVFAFVALEAPGEVSTVFTTTGTEPLLGPMPEGVPYYVDLTFTPDAIGFHDAELLVVSNDPMGLIRKFTLTGHGVEAGTVVPEASSIVVWSLLALVGVGVGCRRHRHGHAR